MSQPSLSEIEKQLELAEDMDYPWMSYAEGVKTAIEWMLGDSDEAPFEEE